MISSFSGFVLLFFCACAYAYIPEAGHILKEFAKNNKFSSLKIDQKRILFPDGHGGGKKEFFEEIFLQHPWKYARKTIHQDRTRLVVYDGSKYLFIQDGKWFEPAGRYSVPFIYGVYLCRDDYELNSFLSRRGINPNAVLLSRAEDAVNFLFSSRDGQRVRLLFERDSFFPVSFFVKGEGGLKDTEHSYGDYKKSAGSPYFPMKMKKHTGEVSEEIEVTSVKAGERFSSTLFDIAYLKKRYPRLETDRTRDFQE